MLFVIFRNGATSIYRGVIRSVRHFVKIKVFLATKKGVGLGRVVGTWQGYS
jgi:hypothetical protein